MAPAAWSRCWLGSGKCYDLSREPAATYFGDLIQRLLGHAVDIDLAGPIPLIVEVVQDTHCIAIACGICHTR